MLLGYTYILLHYIYVRVTRDALRGPPITTLQLHRPIPPLQ